MAKTPSPLCLLKQDVGIVRVPRSVLVEDGDGIVWPLFVVRTRSFDEEPLTRREQSGVRLLDLCPTCLSRVLVIVRDVPEREQIRDNEIRIKLQRAVEVRLSIFRVELHLRVHRGL